MFASEGTVSGKDLGTLLRAKVAQTRQIFHWRPIFFSILDTLSLKYLRKPCGLFGQ